VVTALGKGGAEMTTDQGAIYVTDNTAYTWTAAVQETVDATLNRTVSSGGWPVLGWGRWLLAVDGQGFCSSRGVRT
jgi:photosystem II stability/assembly factor-like uncharacterized protein